jgi:hypothetical protein
LFRNFQQNSFQPSAFSNQLSANNIQPIALSKQRIQPTANSFQPTAFSKQLQQIGFSKQRSA